MKPFAGCPTGWFVTGTDTSSGKTLVAAALAMALREAGAKVVGMKPVATGCRQTEDGLRSEDALALIAASSVHPPYEWANPIAFREPVAPHIAAAKAGVAIELERALGAHRELRALARFVVVEGIGGWRVPLGGGRTLADLAAGLGHPVVLVVGLRLGCISHALLSAEAIRGDGLPLAGWVATQVDPEYRYAEETVAAIRAHLGTPPLATLPWLARPGPGQALPWLRGAARALLGVEKAFGQC